MTDKETLTLTFEGPFLAVFNCHVNDADERAIALVRERVKDKSVVARLEEWRRSGIMEMFNHERNAASEMYACLVFAFTNGITEIEARKIIAERDTEHQQEAEARAEATRKYHQ